MIKNLLMSILLSFMVILGGPAEAVVEVEVNPNVIVADDVSRIGINLGSVEKWGPGQYLKNMFLNPGFEGSVYNQLIPAINITQNSFQEAFWHAGWNKPNVGKPVDFWTGGTFEVLNGPAAGFRGSIVGFTHEVDRGSTSSDLRHTFYVDPPFPATVNPFDTIAVRVDCDPIKFWPESTMDDVRRWAHSKETRPGSPGEYSLKVVGFPSGQSWKNVYTFYMDSYGRDSDIEAGKLTVFKGEYRMGFWAKSETTGTKMTVRLIRASGETFISKTFDLTTDWKFYEHIATIPDGADPYPTATMQPAALTFSFNDANRVVYLDDVYFGKNKHNNNTAFVDEVIQKLSEYNPGVLRFWGDQTGSDLINQLIGPYERKTSDYKPTRSYGGVYTYSFHEFLELCKVIDAEPWYTMPPSLRPEELEGLVEYLAGNSGQWAELRKKQGQEEPWTNVFRKIHIEFGNEMWGTGVTGSDPFAGMSAVGGTRLGQIANRRFGIMRNHPDYNNKLDLVIGGQAGWPPTNKDIAIGGNNATSIAIAPYFGTLKDWSTYENIYGPLLASPEYWNNGGMVSQSYNNVKQGNPNLDVHIYENNFHTTRTTAPKDITNQFVAGFSGALSLSRHSLMMIEKYNIKTQTNFSFVGFSFPNQVSENPFQVRVWGMLRDLLATGRKRPTWLGIELVNKGIFGDMIQSNVINSPIMKTPNINDTPATDLEVVRSYSFRDNKRYGITIYNLDLYNGHTVTIKIPEKTTLDSANYLYADSLITTNEEAENIKIEHLPVQVFNDYYSINLPKTSMATLTFTHNESLPPTTPTSIVPNIIGLSEEEAKVKITENKLEVGVVTEENSDLPQGTVLNQTPIANTIVNQNTTVNFVISSEPPYVEKGIIINQDPTVGTVVPHGSVVNVTVSKGQQPVVVPNLVGIELTSAKETIIGEKLNVGNIQFEHHDTIPVNNVIEQSPVGGSEVAINSNVDLVVSLGPEFRHTPDFVGLNISEVDSIISNSDFVLGEVKEEFNNNIPVNIIISQTPEANELNIPGTKINLVVSKGPEPVVIPNVIGLTVEEATKKLSEVGLSLIIIAENYT